MASGRLILDGSSEPAQLIAQMIALPGVGPWTAHYLAMRALGWPDAFPDGDLVLRKALGGISARQALVLASPGARGGPMAPRICGLVCQPSFSRAHLAGVNQP